MNSFSLLQSHLGVSLQSLIKIKKIIAYRNTLQRINFLATTWRSLWIDWLQRTAEDRRNRISKAINRRRRRWQKRRRRSEKSRKAEVVTLNERLQRRHTTPTLLSNSARMSPKGPGNQDCPKMEVRVSCVPIPGAEPQGIRVRIPEPKKRPMSPPLHESVATRTRCPSVPEKDFYRKTSSLDRRDRYSTLSGAEIKRSLLGAISDSAADAPQTRRRNPMLDRRNRYPTITGAELRRSMAIGKCPLEDGLDLSLAPWPGMKWTCVRVLHLYCKVFDQFELFELIVR